MRVEQVAVVGDCAGCDDGTMIEEMSLEKDDGRHAHLRCQNCDAEAELRHDFEDGLEGGSWSGLSNPRMEPVNWIDCPRCDGYGEIEDPICDLRRAMNGREHCCPNCHGSGNVPRVVATDGGQICDCRETAPDEYDGVDLENEGCPVCECWEFIEHPAGQYLCDGCGSEWSGDPNNATLKHYFDPDNGISREVDTDDDPELRADGGTARSGDDNEYEATATVRKTLRTVDDTNDALIRINGALEEIRRDGEDDPTVQVAIVEVDDGN